MANRLNEGQKKQLEDARLRVFRNRPLIKRLEGIQAHVENRWGENPELPWHTFHGPLHNLKVEEMIYSLIPAEEYDQLTEMEWFCLLTAAWLHDVGMILCLFESDKHAEKSKDHVKRVRDTHHERSVQYIRDNRKVLGLNSHEASIIAKVCEYHRKRLNITDCREREGNIQVRLLAAYLRLADALHLDSTRVDEAQFRLLLAIGMPWDSRFHWLKSKWIRSIVPEPDSLKIRVTVYDTPAESLTRGLLPQLVEDEIQEELDSVRDVLIRGKISFFLDIEIDNVGEPFDKDECTELEMTLSNIKLENLSSASEAADSIIKSVIRLAETAGPYAYTAIQDYLSQMESVLQLRPCHTLIQAVIKIIKDVIQSDKLSDERKVERIMLKLKSYKATRDKKIANLARNASPFLLDRGSILLFGYSNLVLAALEQLPSEARESTQIFIAECRGKTQYSHANEIRYCDGLNYAIKARSAGFTHVTIIPDIVVGNLMARGLINKVVFGANGIDSGTGSFGHTTGHLAIADLARLYEVPVYVIADTAKFGKLNWHEDLERDVQWLTQDRKLLDKLDHYRISTMNPREDVVEPNKITMLITEVGAFPPTQIPKFIDRRLPSA